MARQHQTGCSGTRVRTWQNAGLFASLHDNNEEMLMQPVEH
jgi:hypothetical protein